MRRVCLRVWLFAVLIAVICNLRSAEAAANHLLISQVYYDTIGDDNIEEWVEIFNPTNTTIDLGAYKIGDEETSGGNEGMYSFPIDSKIQSHEKLVIAKNALGFYALYGKYPDFEITTTDDNVSDFSQTLDMTKYSTWASGSLSLTNSGDEILLLDEVNNIVDAVVFESGNLNGVIAHPGVAIGDSIERYPIDADTDNCAVDFRDNKVPSPGYDWTYQATDYLSEQGSIVSDSISKTGQVRKSTAAIDSAGYLFYGPYTTEQSPEMYQVVFRMKVSNNITNNDAIRIDANNCGGSGTWVKKDILSNDFTAPDSWQNFYLYFERKNEGSMEFRVWTYDDVDVTLDNIMIGKVDRIVYEAENFYHKNGSIVHDTSASAGRAWQATSSDSMDHMIYGPYDPLITGKYAAIFVAKIDNNTSNNEALNLDVYNVFGTDQYKKKIIKGTDFKTANIYQSFELDFARNDSGIMEYRALYLPTNTITLDYLIIKKKSEVNYEAEDLFGSTGLVVSIDGDSGGQRRKAQKNTDNEGWMVFGPYTTEQMPGNYQAVFRLMSAENDNSLPVAKINVFNSSGNGIEVEREILGTDFHNSDTWQEFTLDFSRTNQGSMEYRVYFYKQTDISVDWVEVK